MSKSKGSTREMNLELVKCNKNAKIIDAMRIIDANALRTAFIMDENDRITGVMTDGDIRRLLIDGNGLNSVIDTVVNKEFVYAKQDDSVEAMMSKCSNSIDILPIVDDEMHLIDYFTFHDNKRLSLAIPQLNGNEYSYLMDALLSTWISSTGKYVDRFEYDFADYCGMKYGVSTSSGTTALHLALVALGIGEGDEVIVPDITFAATINAVIYTGATPVVVDVERDGWCIDPIAIEAAITPKTKAIIPVHLYGQPCDMGSICQIAEEKHIYVIEDCAEAHGAKWNGKRVGSFGIINCFSFFGNKIVTTGEGGMCLTNDEELDRKMRMYRDHGMKKDRRYYHEVVGYNYRMTNMQAAIGVAQVEHLDKILEWRTELEREYRDVLKSDSRIELQNDKLPNRDKITWLVSVLLDENKRDSVMKALKDNGVEVRPFFIPLSEMDIYRKYATGDYPVSLEISHRGINLPTTYEIDRSKIERIYRIIESAL